MKITVVTKKYTKKSLEASLPVKVNISESLVTKVNNMMMDEHISESFSSNIIGFSSVLSMPHATMDSYVNAVMFTSYRLMGWTYRKCWEYTFPDKYRALRVKGVSNLKINEYVSSYRRGKLLNKVLEQTLIPAYIYNAHHFQEAININVELMKDETNMPRDRINAAAEVLKYTALPESLLDGSKEVAERGMGIIEKLAETMDKYADMQGKMLEDKVISPKEIAESKIYEGEYHEC